jgi:hypothetical protein
MSDDFLDSINCLNEFLVQWEQTGEMANLCAAIKTLLGEFNDLHRLFKQIDDAFERLGDIQYMTEEAIRVEREQTDKLMANVPRCDNGTHAWKCERPATKRCPRDGKYVWCDECAKDHYVVYPGTRYEKLYPSPGATVEDMPIAEPIRAILNARANEKKT